MAWRVTEADVASIIEMDEDDPISVAPFIETANAITDYVAAQDTNGLLSTALLVEIEKYLAAHCYEYRDQAYESRSTEGASAKFQGQFGMGFDSNKWGQMAKRLDVTGTLAKMDKTAPRATFSWLGLPPSQQTDYVDRD